MTRPAPDIVDRIFSGALELPEGERAAFIDSECGDDLPLKERVVELLAATEASADDFDGRFSLIRDRMLDEVLSTEATERSEDLSGLRINHWRLEKRLARGGLATVYLAHRDDGEYNQRAAFKVLRRGLDTDDLVARFRAERQILSSLDHPSIAGILDGGALEDGRPFLVLEFVDGVPITDYCKTRKTGVRSRVRLMLDVLRALHHAHRHLIVHRDIKPSNILVSNDGHVALLDFGIAKLLDPGALPGASTMTRTGMSLMTPGYCSPEQAAGAAVTTASDIYQAGAVLYELLTGDRPRLASTEAGSVDLPLPSTTLRGKADYGEVRGDLDAIVRKATHGDPAQRYASADEMEADLKRYLDGRPVLAQPDTFGYRLGKLHKRRPWAAPVVVAAVLTVAGYVYTLLAYNDQLRIEQQRAAAAQSFMIDILSSADPYRPADPQLGSNITVVEALGFGVQRLETEILDDLELRASILAAIARVYSSLDRHEQAIALREEALDIERDVFGVPSEPVVASLRMLAGEYLKTDDYGAADRYLRQQLDFARQLYPDDAPMVGAAEAAAGDVAAGIGNFEESRSLYERGIEKMRRSPEEFGQRLIDALTSLARQLEFDEPETAFELLGEARQHAEALFGLESLQMAQVRKDIAALYSATRQFEKAEREFLNILPVFDAELGPDHSATLDVLSGLGILYGRMSQNEKAAAIYSEALDRYVGKYGESHRLVADAYQNLATAYSRIARYDQSIPMHDKAYELYKAILPQEQPVHAYPLLSKAFAEISDGRFDSAEDTSIKALDIVGRTAPDTYLVGVAKCLVSRALEGQGDPDAVSMMGEAHEILIGSVVSDTYRRFCRVPD